MGPNSFIFTYIFTEKCLRQRSTPLPYGKSWILHWIFTLFNSKRQIGSHRSQFRFTTNYHATLISKQLFNLNVGIVVKTLQMCLANVHVSNKWQEQIINILCTCYYSASQKCKWLIIFTIHDTSVKIKGRKSWDFPIYEFTNLQLGV